MKQLIITLNLHLSFLLLTGCSTIGIIQPSNNEALNSISNSSAKSEKGSMQKTLDSWLSNEWSPTVEKDVEIQEKYMKKVNDTNNTEVKYVEDKEKSFTLQEYVDKRAAYVKAHPADHNNSHLHKIETMPVIGTTRKR